MPRVRLPEVVDRFYPWPVKAEAEAGPSGRRLRIWYFDEGHVTKDEPLLPAHEEPWQRLSEEHRECAARISRKLEGASLVPWAITDALWMLRSFYVTPPDPRSLFGPPSVARVFTAQEASEVEVVGLSDVAQVLIRLMACLDRGSEDDPTTVEDVAAILLAHPDELAHLYGSCWQTRRSSFESAVRWLRKKLNRFQRRTGLTTQQFRAQLLREPDLLAELASVGREGARWMTTLTQQEHALVQALIEARPLQREREAALVRSLRSFLLSDS